MKAIASNGVEINTGDEVLTRSHSKGTWVYNYFSHYDGSDFYPFITSRGNFDFCIPYNGNEHLVGTTDNYTVFKKENKSLTYEEKQKRWIDRHNIKIGDKVKITRNVKYDHENGWLYYWISKMDKTVGEIAEIIQIKYSSILLKTSISTNLLYPYHILEKVEDTFKFRLGAKVKFTINEKEKEGILTNYTGNYDREPYLVTWLDNNSDIGCTSRTWTKEITYID